MRPREEDGKFMTSPKAPKFSEPRRASKHQTSAKTTVVAWKRIRFQAPTILCRVLEDSRIGFGDNALSIDVHNASDLDIAKGSALEIPRRGCRGTPTALCGLATLRDHRLAAR